jgi:hypothetical protein
LDGVMLKAFRGRDHHCNATAVFGVKDDLIHGGTHRKTAREMPLVLEVMSAMAARV